MPLNLQSPVDQAPMVGPAYAKRLNKLGLETIKDLLHHYPFRYQDLSLIKQISQIKPDELVTLEVEVISCKNIPLRNGKKIQKAIVQDDTGNLEVTWFNQVYLPNTLKEGTRINLSGKTNIFRGKLGLVSPSFEVIKNKPSIHTGGLISIYPETAKLSSKWLRSRLKFVLDTLDGKQLEDWLSPAIKKQEGLIDLKPALENIHFPKNQDQLDKAIKRLAFDEMLLLQLKALKRKKTWSQKTLNHPLKLHPKKTKELLSSLPFQLTSDQQKAYQEIFTDLKSTKPMNRLLQGDVGSGKTVVAALGLHLSYLNHHQSVLMAPTEILAHQHFDTLKLIFKHTSVKISLITRNNKGSLKADILVGTHALLFKKINLNQVSLVVIDEQHRFGVKQREALLNKSPSTPHLLTMTATPIPRTVALTALSDLDLSSIDELPSKRIPIKTWLVPQTKKTAAYTWIQKEINVHHTQAYFVSPLINPSDSPLLKDISNVTDEFNKLKKIFPDLKLDLLHGSLKSVQKKQAFKDFNDHKTQILVSTPVIEVGIDVPNATIMVINDADRFGLAQLHQLRGRVGRSDKPSYCLLFTNNQSSSSIKRLKHLENLNSGKKLAEIDLKLRGAGDLFGLQQHGFLDLKLASYADTKLIKQTKAVAQNFIAQSLSSVEEIIKTE